MTLPEIYESQFNEAVLNEKHLPEIDYFIHILLRGEVKYQKVANILNNGIHWWFIGIIHVMEGGGKFTKHLHNGDSLNARTINVPKGRPKQGHPPFTWEESALDALRYTKLDKVTDWSIGNCLDLFEKYNGLGYRKKGVPSPYLWSFTNFYEKGKYVKDGKYDPEAVSKQPGCAAILLRMKSKKLI